MTSRIGSLALRAPFSLAFCCISFVVLAVSIAAPASLPYLILFPENVKQRGYVWVLLTYAVLPTSILHLLVVSVPVLWVGWYIEPVLGRARYLGLLIGGALGASIFVPISSEMKPNRYWFRPSIRWRVWVPAPVARRWHSGCVGVPDRRRCAVVRWCSAKRVPEPGVHWCLP
jgi:membrane associated rhomboid family serine protease